MPEIPTDASRMISSKESFIPSPASLAKQLSLLYSTRYLRSYTYWKVRTDPLYGAVTSVLQDAGSHPLVDLGCGAGFFAFYLKTAGHTCSIHGLDVDAEKILAARCIADKHWPETVTFDIGDFADWQPGNHQGHVTLLDVLQYLAPERQEVLLRQAASCLTHPGHRLIIRNGLDDASWRATVTRTTDHLARWVRWMARSPRHHPSRASIESILTDCGLHADFAPLWGATPFNNYFIVARRAEPWGEPPAPP